MKRSPASAASSTSSNSCSASASASASVSPSSPSSSSPDSLVHNLPEKPKAKRVRKHQNSDKKCSSLSDSNSSTSGRRSSIYRGVTRHRWTGRFEAHLWDKSSWNSIQTKKGKQVYLGAYDSEAAAARAYDLAALKYWGPETILNFSIERYEKEMEEMNKVSKDEYLASLRRRSNGFSRGVSKYRGVARHHHNGRWEARIGRVFGNKYLYLGTYSTQEEAAAAYDMAALEYRGANAVTNFDISHYIERLKQKGILILDQTQERIPDSADAQRAEPEIEHPPQQQQQQQQQEQQSQEVEEADEPQHFDPYMQMQLPLCIDNATMDGVEPNDSNELAWSFCMDSGLTSFLVSDFPLERTGELPNLFDCDTGFEDNIDSMFDVIHNENEAMNMAEDNAKEMSLSSSAFDSPYSSTTSLSCKYGV